VHVCASHAALRQAELLQRVQRVHIPNHSTGDVLTQRFDRLQTISQRDFSEGWRKYYAPNTIMIKFRARRGQSSDVLR
jgi:hypothetical protein